MSVDLDLTDKLLLRLLAFIRFWRKMEAQGDSTSAGKENKSLMVAWRDRVAINVVHCVIS
jgi:hypothetical protein